MHFSNNYGFGMVDAVSAVRLAESWQETSVRNNTEVAKASSTKNIAITDNSAAGITDSVVVNGNLRIDRVEVDLKINHTFVGDLKVELISPDGTVSTVIDRPGVGSKTRYGISDDNINFTVSSNAFWGEESSGNWRLKVYDLNLRDVGNLVSWNLNVYGDDNVNDDNYVFTNEYSSLVLKDPSRSTISDSGGIDTLNLSANAGNNIINLSAGAINQVGGAAMVIAAGTVIENVFTGDGNDVIIANAENNKIMGGRGNDIISTGKGSDTVILRPEQEGRDVIKDFNVNADKIDLSDYDFTFVADTFSIFMQNHVAQESLGALLNLGGSVAAILENVAASALGFEDFIF
jgi:subtilisin-like proprotein convertase family protein